MTANITELSQELFTKAQSSARGLATANLRTGNSILKHVLIALTAGSELEDHPNPGEATVTVMSGAVEVGPAQSESAEAVQGREGDVLTVPQCRHYLRAQTAALVMLTVVRTP